MSLILRKLSYIITSGIDLQIETLPVSLSELSHAADGESSAAIHKPIQPVDPFTAAPNFLMPSNSQKAYLTNKTFKSCSQKSMPLPFKALRLYQ